jgi:hypothetical protein
LIYGAGSIVSQIGRFIYVFAFFLPVQMAFYDTILAPARGGPPPAVVAGMKIGLVVGVCIGLVGFVYPIIVLILLSRPSIAAAFRGEGAAGDYGDYDDYEDRYRRPGRRRDADDYPPGYSPEPDDRFGPAQR